MVRPVCGSPPRGRGKVAGAACRDLLGGITPAWAGKRRCTAACNRLCWDHPRVGGEKPTMLGSPQTCRGITPAWAGKSQGRRAGKRQAQDHPRVGGEKPARRRAFKRPTGSPPRGRGKVSGASAIASLMGITPAWAGKSLFSECYQNDTRDHPRVGGEKSPRSMFIITS